MPNEEKSISAAGGYGNMVLYRMCADQPAHVDREIAFSKARMIAKVYEVSRNLGNNYELIAEVLCSHKLALDEMLVGFANVSLTNSNTSAIVELHGRLDRLLCKALRKDAKGRNVHSRASFVSKYLHFHRPDTFPILDSLAEGAIKNRLRGQLLTATMRGENASDRYERFCRAVVQLQDSDEFARKSLREIDTVLVEEGRTLRARQKN